MVALFQPFFIKHVSLGRICEVNVTELHLSSRPAVEMGSWWLPACSFRHLSVGQKGISRRECESLCDHQFPDGTVP